MAVTCTIAIVVGPGVTEIKGRNVALGANGSVGSAVNVGAGLPVGAGVLLMGTVAVIVGIMVGAGGRTVGWQPAARIPPKTIKISSVFVSGNPSWLRQSNILNFSVNNRNSLLDTILVA